MADLRSRENDLIWFQYGTGDQGAGNLAVPAVYASGTSFTIAGVDVTTVYHIGRRVRAVGSGTGTIYGRISASSFSTNTTVTAVWDSGSLSNETLVVSLSQIPVTGSPFGNVTTAWTPADGSGAALSFTGVSAGYTRIGNMVFVYGVLTYPANASGANAIISGLPYASANANYAAAGSVVSPDKYAGVNTISMYPIKNTTTAQINYVGTAAAGQILNSTLATVTLNFSFMYPIA